MTIFPLQIYLDERERERGRKKISSLIKFIVPKVFKVNTCFYSFPSNMSVHHKF